MRPNKVLSMHSICLWLYLIKYMNNYLDVERSRCEGYGTYSEQHKESLILLSYTVINPGTVVIHLLDASFTNTAHRRQKQLQKKKKHEEKEKMELKAKNEGKRTRWQTQVPECSDLQWCALSGLMLQHLGHLYMTSPGFNCKLSMYSFVALPFGTAPWKERKLDQSRRFENIRKLPQKLKYQ